MLSHVSIVTFSGNLNLYEPNSAFFWKTIHSTHLALKKKKKKVNPIEFSKLLSTWEKLKLETLWRAPITLSDFTQKSSEEF